MKKQLCLVASPSMIILLLAFAAATAGVKEYKSGLVWPEPKVVDPGPPGGPPSDAIVLFDGKDLSAWEGGERWIVKDGVATASGGAIRTKEAFGDCQLHVEWAAPDAVKGSGQQRGNSGVYLMGKYELQVLDSYDNPTYFDGQCGAIYKQRPPLVNACRKPGEWQTYDIIFKAPRFDAQGKLLRPATMTVLHNGVLIQDHFELLGATSYVRAPRYSPHPDKLPLSLQFHGNPVRYRNIWIRPLAVPPAPKRVESVEPSQPQAAEKATEKPRRHEGKTESGRRAETRKGTRVL